MLSQYIQAAMQRTRYEIIKDELPYYGEISECPGVWASGRDLEECRGNLVEALEGWLVLSLQRDLPIPELDGIKRVVY